MDSVRRDCVALRRVVEKTITIEQPFFVSRCLGNLCDFATAHGLVVIPFGSHARGLRGLRYSYFARRRRQCLKASTILDLCIQCRPLCVVCLVVQKFETVNMIPRAPRIRTVGLFNSPSREQTLLTLPTI